MAQGKSGLTARSGGLGSAPLKPASAAPQQRSAMAPVQKAGSVQAAPRKALGDISNAQVRSQPIGGPVKLQASLKPLPSPAPTATRIAPKISAPIIQSAAPLSRSVLLSEAELLSQYGMVDAPKSLGRYSPPAEEDEPTRATAAAFEKAIAQRGGMYGVTGTAGQEPVRPGSPIPWSKKSQEEMDLNAALHLAASGDLFDFSGVDDAELRFD